MKLLLIVATLLGLVLLTTAGGGRRRKCPFIDRPENGYGRGSRRIGNSIRFSCKRGYWLQGPQSLTCLDVKGQPTWSSSVVPFCVLKSDHIVTCAVTELTVGSLSGTLRFTDANGTTTITGQVTNLPQGPHGFHVHVYGDFSNGCASAAGHYNPQGRTHGAPSDVERHVGDLGNIVADVTSTSTVNIVDSVISLNGPFSILGRSIVIHAGEDDLGTGGDAGSMATGNAGARLGCGVIAVAACP